MRKIVLMLAIALLAVELAEIFWDLKLNKTGHLIKFCVFIFVITSGLFVKHNLDNWYNRHIKNRLR